VKQIWRHVAFLGRHGRQPADVCLALPYTDLMELSECVADMLRQESDTMKQGIDA
jgi:hypothetical protein